jgi:hypothetical protein
MKPIEELENFILFLREIIENQLNIHRFCYKIIRDKEFLLVYWRNIHWDLQEMKVKDKEHFIQ